MKNKILKLFYEGKTYKQIIESLGCSKSTVSYHCKNLVNPRKVKKKVNKKIEQKINTLYLLGNSLQEVANILKISRSTVKRYKTVVRSKKTASDAVGDSRRLRKLKLVLYKGCKCEVCGYNKSLRALHFHHRDPEEKEFSISSKNISLDRLKEEVDKCDLLCSNCHCEEHDRLDLLKL